MKGHFHIDCIGKYGYANEENGDFNYTWTQPRTFEDPISQKDKAWRFQKWDELDTYPIWAELYTYYSGGYVVEMFPRWKNAQIFKDLKERKWLDRYSRAVIVEFALFNAATNHFNSITIVMEFPPSGGVIHYSSILTFKMYRYTAGYEFFVIGCEVIFLLYILIFLIRESRLIHKQGWSYFTEFWNLVEFSIIFLSVLSVFFYFYREKLAKELMTRINNRVPNVYVNFQFAANWDLCFSYIVALIVFFVMIKFIKLLRFNKRICLLSNSLRVAWYPLSMLSVILGEYIADS